MRELTFRTAETHKLEDPERLKWLPPDEILARIGLRRGMCVADIGAGTGYFAIPIARAVGESGRVYAVDFQPEMLNFLREKRTQPDAPGNIDPIVAEAAHTRLPDESCDLVFLANVWHELDDRQAALREFARILAPGGRLALIDWRHDASPPPGPLSEHRISMRTTVCTLEQDGWELHHYGAAGPYSYLLIAGIADQGQQS